VNIRKLSVVRQIVVTPAWNRWNDHWLAEWACFHVPSTQTAHRTSMYGGNEIFWLQSLLKPIQLFDCGNCISFPDLLQNVLQNRWQWAKKVLFLRNSRKNGLLVHWIFAINQRFYWLSFFLYYYYMVMVTMNFANWNYKAVDSVVCNLLWPAELVYRMIDKDTAIQQTRRPFRARNLFPFQKELLYYLFSPVPTYFSFLFPLTWAGRQVSLFFFSL
jgi:hypothetical protein